MSQALGGSRHAKSAPYGRLSIAAIALLSGIVGAAAARYVSVAATPPKPATEPTSRIAEVEEIEAGEKDHREFVSVALPVGSWKTSGLQMQPASRRSLTSTVRLTGKVSLNEDKIAHLYPLVEGTVDEVLVGLGQRVKSNDLLAVVHSREVGQAKLDLYQARLQHEMAVVKHNLEKDVAANTRELLSALRNGEPIDAIEGRFRSRSMGDYRERLLLAYASYLKSEADVERLEGPAQSGAVSAKQLYAAQSSKNADQATFQARIEQIDYELQTSLLSTSQAVKEAATRVAVATTSLRILGCDDADIASIDPVEQGEAISHYSIRAPFDGTIVAKDLTLKEQVRPDSQVFTVADLSTVWISADIYEQNVPLLASVAGQSVRVHNDAWPDRSFAATVFYTGEIMDPATRTITMRAVAKNEDHLLKPGMFVTITLDGGDGVDRLVVPASALQEHEGQKFVFVRQDGDDFEPRIVNVGQANEEDVAIIEGLTEGEEVVTSGGFILKSRMLENLMGED